LEETIHGRYNNFASIKIEDVTIEMLTHIIHTGAKYTMPESPNFGFRYAK
jgi:hypothetical protein